MGAGNRLQRNGLRHGIKRNPKADALLAANAIVGLVLMPRRHDRGARLLDQDMIMKELARLRAHQPCSDGAG